MNNDTVLVACCEISVTSPNKHSQFFRSAPLLAWPHRFCTIRCHALLAGQDAETNKAISLSPQDICGKQIIHQTDLSLGP
jgi:hypothetical protein